ncbi:UNVERIFIED_CONTAM: hypothetical protein PYX00_004387 [Menopon gallinae]|uniref:Uncharacterized protein n=1 Tax=Menopon gallinae TaxID=328185 RepID=A0AAW2I3F2_9NEOP
MPRTGQQFFNSRDGTYHFEYDTGDSKHQSFRGESRDEHGAVKGYYGYVDPDGVLRLTEYVADRMGYRSKTTLRYPVFTE